jgi:hypothetical protein
VDGSAELAAVTVTVVALEPPKELYSPLLLIVPQVAPLHPAPCTFHVTAVFDVPATRVQLLS